MSFSAYSRDNEKFYSYTMTDDQWKNASQKNCSTPLTLACCGSTAVCVQKNGLRYFDHPKDSKCPNHPLAHIDHVKNKKRIIDALLKCGWSVQTETHIEKCHFAEIYATKNSNKLVVDLSYRMKGAVKYKHKKEKFVREVTKTLLDDHGTKILWLIEFDEDVLKHSLEDTLKSYNKHATVFALDSKHSELSVFGVCKTFTKNKFRLLGGMTWMKLGQFVQDFFVDRKILRRQIDPKTTKLYYEYVELKCVCCGKKTIGLTYISAFCQFIDGNYPQTMLIGKLWYTKTNIEQVHDAINADIAPQGYCTRLGYHTFYDPYKNDLLTKVRQNCRKTDNWFGIIATAITYKRKYTSKPLVIKRIQHDNIADCLADWVWILKDEERELE